MSQTILLFISPQLFKKPFLPHMSYKNRPDLDQYLAQAGWPLQSCFLEWKFQKRNLWK